MLTTLGKHLPYRSASTAVRGVSFSSFSFHRKAPLRAFSSQQHNSVAFVAIGDELLNGKIADTNLAYLAAKLTPRGVTIKRAEFVRDNLEDIEATLRRLRKEVVPGPTGAIITSGGIGPTHDDITYDAVAAAVNTHLDVHAGTLERMTRHYESQGKEVNEARMRMATLPVSAEVLTTDGLWVPVVNADNTYVLPGIPRLFRSLVDAHIDRFRGDLGNWRLVNLYTTAGEGDYATKLGELAARYPTVSIGSYPGDMTSSKQETKLTVEGFNESDVDAAAEEVKQLVGGIVREERKTSDV